jgi:hypothetical protein
MPEIIIHPPTPQPPPSDILWKRNYRSGACSLLHAVKRVNQSDLHKLCIKVVQFEEGASKPWGGGAEANGTVLLLENDASPFTVK